MNDFIFSDEPDGGTTNVTSITNGTLIQDNVDAIDEYAFRKLSDSQLTALAILPVPSAILSVFGSSAIIYMAYLSKKAKPWTPYNRLLVAMSVYDIITSIALGMASFLNPTETSNKALAFGNDSTCSATGFFNQLSYSGTLYNAALSYYFLLTARFGMKNNVIAKWIEPTIHVISVLFPLITAFVGLFLGVYHEPEVGIGCWVNRYPERCGYGPDGTGEPCQAAMIAWIFGGWIAFFTLLSLIINNLIIWIFVRRRVNDALKNAGAVEGDDTGSIAQVSLASSLRTGRYTRSNGSTRSVAHASRSNTSTKSGASTGLMNEDVRRSQQKRLRLVSSQAFLFVMSFLVSNFPTYLLRIFESVATSYVWEMELPYNNYILMILQAVLLPLQGLFNMMVFVRPKVLKNRSDFPRESRTWALRRAIWGANIVPVHSLHGEIDIQNDEGKQKNKNAHQQALSKDMISSLTNGSATGREEENEDEASRPPSFHRKASEAGGRRSNSLEMISEAVEHPSDLDISANTGGNEYVEQRMISTTRGQDVSATILMDGSIVERPHR